MIEAPANPIIGKYQSPFPHGIMFHHFYSDKHPPGGQGALSEVEFDAILNFIGPTRFLTPEEWIYRLKAGKLQNDDLCITFDDGLKCQYDICVPILDKYGLKCFWFVYSSVHQGELERFEIYRCFRAKYFENVECFFRAFFDIFDRHHPELDNELFKTHYQTKVSLYPFYSRNDVRYRYIRDEILAPEEFEALMDDLINERGLTAIELSENLWLTDSHLETLNTNGHLIGLHSYSHPTAIAKMSYSEQVRQYERNYRHIREVCGTEPLSMAHPNNSYNDNTLEILGKLNIVCGFRSNMASLGGGTGSMSVLEIPRMDHANIRNSLA